MTRGSVALVLILVAGLSWAGFWGLVVMLSNERAEYAKEFQDNKSEGVRLENASRVRSLVQDTETERAALENLLQVDLLRAVETIEQAGESAGAKNVVIGQATPSSAPEGLSAAVVVVNADGSFASLVRALSLLEVVPISAALQQFELTKPDEGNGWDLTARLRVLSSQ